MAAGGYTAEPVGWLVQTPHKLTSAQITDARHRAAAAGITTEVRTGPDDTPAASCATTRPGSACSSPSASWP